MSKDEGIGSVHMSLKRSFAQIYEQLLFSETGPKDESGFPVKRLPKDSSGDCGSNSFRIFTILFPPKKSEKILGKSN